jgi:cellulose synthase/poly-beta-1,6-N-acetylglucosamine synthase-like glycosyltransferase
MDLPLLAASVLALAGLAASCLIPLRTEPGDDRGDGRTRVVIPRPVPPSRYHPRTWAFLGIAATLGLVFVGWRRPQLPVLYAAAVRNVADAITANPAAVNGYIARLRPATLFLATAYIVGIALVSRATPARRLAMLSHAILYLAASLLAQSLMIVTGVETGWLVAPFGIEATLLNLLIGGLVITRLTVTCFVLPRTTTMPVRRPRWIWDSLLAWCAIVCALATLICAYALLSEDSNLTDLWQLFLPLYAVSLLFAVMFAPLCLMWWISARMPPAGRERPPVDVIVPAYNEAENVGTLLASIDIAAGRYGGPVRVIVSNDGSRDDTEAIALRSVAAFRHASGTVLTEPNGGQSAALNRALRITTADVVIRIDADCVMGPDALVYTMPWFDDPVVGGVGAMEQPRADHITWFHRMRTLEALFQFRFARLGQSLVDGVVVVPGTYTAFRRGPALQAGGFPEGMNGEDADLTMQLGRAGYRMVLDPRICCFEDVPRSVSEFIEQRTRWARGGFHIYGRHQPVRGGLAGPRVWLWTVRRSFSWFSLQAGMVAPVFMAELALFNPGYRSGVGVLAVLYVCGGSLPLVVCLPLAVRHREWRAIAWMPTWFAFAFLRRLGTLEAAISLPTRPLPVRVSVPGPAATGRRLPVMTPAGPGAAEQPELP